MSALIGDVDHGGVYMDVPGDGVASMEAGLLQAFAQIAGKVPPATLVYEQ